jgi:hypothetical protein
VVRELLEVCTCGQAAEAYNQLPLLIGLIPFYPEDMIKPAEAADSFKHWLKESSSSVKCFAIVRSLAVTLVTGLPVLLLTFFPAVECRRVFSVTINTFSTACAAMLRCSTAIGTGPVTLLGGRNGNDRWWAREVVGGGMGCEVGSGSGDVCRLELRQCSAIVGFHVHGGQVHVLMRYRAVVHSLDLFGNG